MPKFPPKQQKPIPVMTGARHVFMLADPPCVVIPIAWGSAHAHAQGFQQRLALDVFADGERVSHAVSLAEDGVLEVSFRIDPGEYEVVVKEAPTGDRTENRCAVLFARKLRVDSAGDDDEDEGEDDHAASATNQGEK
jgi:hypothetical protein